MEQDLCKVSGLLPAKRLTFCLFFFDSLSATQVPPIGYPDFVEAVKHVRASVDEKDLDLYVDWNKRFGSGTW